MNKLLAGILLSTLFSCATPNRAPSSLSPGDLPTTERDNAFAQTLAGLDLEDSAYKLSYKDTGTSIGFKIKRDKEKFGKWLPKNEAANPEAQVVSYYLGRYLGMGDMVLPSGFHTIQGRTLSEFHQMLLEAKERIRLRIVNRDALLEAYQKNSETMDGVFTPPVESFELPDLIDTSANHGLGTLRQDQPIAAFVRADGPVPSSSREIVLGGPKQKNGKRASNTELSLARELSKLMVLDVLCGQFDRFSGGNLEGTVDENLKLHFIARDNGGANMGPGYDANARYFPILTRFDRAQIRQLEKLGAEVKTDPAATAKFFQIRSNPKVFAGRVTSLLAHVAAQVSAYGEAAVFFPD